MNWVVVVALLVAAGAFVWSPRTASACTFAAPFDPVESSDVIIAGRVTGWDAADDIEPRFSQMPIRIHFDVDRTLKGVSKSQVDLIEFVSREGVNGEVYWDANSCSSFGDDPTGEYRIIGLDWSGDYYMTYWGLGFYSGDEAAGTNYENALARASQSTAAGDGSSPAVIGAVIGTLLVGIAISVGVGVRLSRGPKPV